MAKRALVLSGGGARGAYEAGVLRFIVEEMPKRFGVNPQFDIVSGTSVGAIHAVRCPHMLPPALQTGRLPAPICALCDADDDPSKLIPISELVCAHECGRADTQL